MSEDNKEQIRNIYINQGNYTENIQGNYNEQSENLSTGNISEDEIIEKLKIDIRSIDKVHKSILEEFKLETAKKIIDKFVAPSDNNTSPPYIEFLEQITQNTERNLTAIRGEAGSGKSLVAKATYVYLNHILNGEEYDIKPYYINWLWTVEKDFATNEHYLAA